MPGAVFLMPGLRCFPTGRLVLANESLLGRAPPQCQFLGPVKVPPWMSTQSLRDCRMLLPPTMASVVANWPRTRLTEAA